MVREETGQLSSAVQRRLHASDVDELVAAYRAGATINELAERFAVHRNTIAAHLGRRRVERHGAATAWSVATLTAAADLYANGASLAAVGARYGIDATTVANRFRGAHVAIRPRPAWPPRSPS